MKEAKEKFIQRIIESICSEYTDFVLRYDEICAELYADCLRNEELPDFDDDAEDDVQEGIKDYDFRQYTALALETIDVWERYYGPLREFCQAQPFDARHFSMLSTLYQQTRPRYNKRGSRMLSKQQRGILLRIC